MHTLKKLLFTFLLPLCLIFVSQGAAAQLPDTPIPQTLPSQYSDIAVDLDGAKISMEVNQATDFGAQLLNEVFGLESAAGTALTPLGSLMVVYNAVVLLAAAVIFLFIIFMVPIKTAEDGEFMGRWNSTFVPFRMVLALVLIFPVVSGYSLAQAGVLWLLKNPATGAANVAATAVVKGFSNNVASFQSLSSSADSDGGNTSLGLARDLFLANVCMTLQNQKAGYSSTQIKSQMASLQNSTLPYRATVISGDSPIIQFGFNPNYTAAADGASPSTVPALAAKSSNYCGEVELKPVEDRGILDTSGGKLLGDKQVTAAMGALHNSSKSAQMQLLQDYQTKLSNLAVNYVSDFESSGEVGMTANAARIGQYTANTLPQMLQAIAVDVNASYASNVRTSLNSLLIANKENRFIDQMKNDIKASGWMSLGTMMWVAGKHNQFVESYLSAMPSFSSGNYFNPDEQKTLDTKDKDYMTQLNALLNSPSFYATPGMGITESGSKFLAELLSYDPSKRVHPMVQAQNVGEWLTIGSMTLYSLAVVGASVDPENADIKDSLLKKAVGKATSIAASFTGAGRIADWVVELFTTLGSLASMAAPLMFGAGFLLGTVLVFLPMIHWIVGIMGWLISVFTLIVGVPIGVAAMMMPMGDDITGMGGMAIKIMVETLVRPLFMVFGFLAAFLLSYPVLGLNNYLFFTVFNSTDTGVINSAVFLLGGVLIYAVLSFYLMHKLFELIRIIPQSAMEIIGVNGFRHSDDANGVHHNTVAIFSRKGGSDFFSNIGSRMMPQRPQEKELEKKR